MFAPWSNGYVFYSADFVLTVLFIRARGDAVYVGGRHKLGTARAVNADQDMGHLFRHVSNVRHRFGRRAQGEKPSALHNNCSGKHAGMLSVALAMGACGYVPLEACFARGGYETLPVEGGAPREDTADRLIEATFANLARAKG
mgnify:CR=1 FL=1